MGNIILQHNLFLKNMAIAPRKGIQEINKDNMNQIFIQSPYFTGFEPTRKIAEGRF